MLFRSNRYIDPQPAMYPTCSHWFPEALAPSVSGTCMSISSDGLRFPALFFSGVTFSFPRCSWSALRDARSVKDFFAATLGSLVLLVAILVAPVFRLCLLGTCRNSIAPF